MADNRSSYNGSQASLRSTSTLGQQTTHSPKIWKCSSAISKYTNKYCKEKQNITGCYKAGKDSNNEYVSYKSCGRRCNDAEEHSRFVEACDAFCPGYYSRHGDCTLVFKVMPTSIASTTTVSATTATTSSANTTIAKSTPNNSNEEALTDVTITIAPVSGNRAVEIGIPVALLGFLLGAATAAIITAHICIKKQNNNNPDDIGLQRSVTETDSAALTGSTPHENNTLLSKERVETGEATTEDL